MRFGTRSINRITGCYNSDIASGVAAAHIARVIADGGTIIDQAQTTAFIKALYLIYGNFTNVTTVYDPQYMGYKLGAGSGSTLGRGLAKLYALDASADQIQNTAASQPLLLTWSGENYVFNTGVTGNGFSTPNNINNDLSGNFAIETKINLVDLNATQILDAKYASPASQQYTLLVSATTLILRMYNGVEFNVTSASIAAFAGTTWWARVSRNSTTGVVKFFTSTNGTTFTQLGSDQISIIGALNNPAIDRRIGAFRSTFQSAVLGQIFYSNIYKDDSFTTVTQSFNPTSYVSVTSQSTWTSTTGEVYTRVRDTATTGLKAAIVDRTMVMTNGTSHAMRAASFTQNSAAFTYYGAVSKFNNSATTLIAELGADAASASGFYVATNDGSANTDSVAINGNVGINGSNYSSNSLLLRLITAIGDTTLSSPETLFYNNNAAATLNATFASANNTGNMNGTALNLFGRNNGASLWFNGSFRTMVLTNQSDNSTIRAAVYSFISAYNNGGF